jgi:hypothetical protein
MTHLFWPHIFLRETDANDKTQRSAHTPYRLDQKGRVSLIWLRSTFDAIQESDTTINKRRNEDGMDRFVSLFQLVPVGAPLSRLFVSDQCQAEKEYQSIRTPLHTISLCD